MDRPAEDAPHRLALIELLDRDGRPARCVDVHAWPLTIGRALSNHIVIDDPHAAAHHARMAPDAQGRLVLTVLGSLNGVTHDGRRINALQPWPLPAGGAALQMGSTRLRLRLPDEVLAPEKPLPGLAGGRQATPLLAGVPLLALLLAGHSLSLDPGAAYPTWLPLLVGWPLGLAAWCGAWALMSKLFQHRFDFAGHLRIALPWLLTIAAVEALWPQLAASLAAPWLWHLAPPLLALLLALLVRAHLMHVLPLHERVVSLAVAAMALSGGGISLALTQRSSDSYSSAPYMSTLPLPLLRLAGTVPATTLVQAMAPLADRLARRVKKARDDEDDDGVDAGTD